MPSFFKLLQSRPDKRPVKILVLLILIGKGSGLPMIGLSHSWIIVRKSIVSVRQIFLE